MKMDYYDDIINLPHYEPKHHPRMTMWNRAAQFAPFAALTGYDAAIRESGRITDKWIGVEDFENENLNRTLVELSLRLQEQPSVTVEYFQSDELKAGGSYQVIVGNIRRIDDYQRVIEMMDGHIIPIDFIKGITIKEPAL